MLAETKESAARHKPGTERGIATAALFVLARKIVLARKKGLVSGKL